jgi:hypothetical protein
MAQLIFGKSLTRKIIFASDNEFYEALGFLCNVNNNIRLVLERNDQQGAWAPEGRMEFFLNRNYPLYFVNSFTAGVGRKIHRTNNTEYCDYLKNNHAIIDGFVQNINNVRATIPAQFIADFNRGMIL